jgi:hypothetical protein
VLRVDCDRCGRHGRYPVAKLLKDHGGDTKLGEWFSKLTKTARRSTNPASRARAMPSCRTCEAFGKASRSVMRPRDQCRLCAISRPRCVAGA